MNNLIPKYTKQARLTKQLKKYIADVDLQPGEKLPSERRLIEMYGMSRITVRAALKMLENENIADTIAGKGTFIRQLPMSQTRNITFIFSEEGWSADSASLKRDDFGKTFLINGFGVAGSSKPININFCYIHPDKVTLDEALAILSETGSDGFLFAELSGYEKIIEALSERGKICVVRAFQPETIKGAYIIWADLGSEFYAATLGLLNAGRKKVAYIGFDTAYDTVKIDGVKKAIFNAGLDERHIDRIYLSENFSFRAYIEVEKYFRSEQSKDTDLLICCNDDIAIASMAALKEMGISVPSEVAVFGTDNITQCTELTPALSSIAYPFYEMGMKVYEIFDSAFSGNPIPHRSIAFACNFIPRSST